MTAIAIEVVERALDGQDWDDESAPPDVVGVLRRGTNVEARFAQKSANSRTERFSGPLVVVPAELLAVLLDDAELANDTIGTLVVEVPESPVAETWHGVGALAAATFTATYLRTIAFDP